MRIYMYICLILILLRFHHSPYNPDTHAGSPIPIPLHPYRTIGCVFNDRSFYANIQPSDSVLTSQYNLHNGTQWKSMSRDAIAALKQVMHSAFRYTHYLNIIQIPEVIPSITMSQLKSDILSSDLEQELMSIITQHRMVHV